MTMTPRDALLALLPAYAVDRKARLHDAATDRPDDEVYADMILSLLTPAQSRTFVLYDTVMWQNQKVQITALRGEDEYHIEHVHPTYTTWMWVKGDSLSSVTATPLPTPDLFTRLITASPSYVLRFKGRITKQGALTAMERELAEVYEAMDALLRTPDDPALLKAFAGEMCDVIVTLGGLAHALHVTPESIANAATATLEKLGKRKEADYVWHEESLTVIARSKLEGVKP